MLPVTSTTLTPKQDGTVAVGLGCGTGAEGCAGTVVAIVGGKTLGSVPFDLVEEATGALSFPTPVPRGANAVSFAVHMAHGVGPSPAVVLPVTFG